MKIETSRHAQRTDEHGAVIHCEICEMFPATFEIESGLECFDVCSRPQCRADAREMLKVSCS